MLAGQEGEGTVANEAVCSPCVGLCKLDANTLICGGCLRSAEEIGLWRDASNSVRLFILEQVAKRRNGESSPSGSS